MYNLCVLMKNSYNYKWIVDLITDSCRFVSKLIIILSWLFSKSWYRLDVLKIYWIASIQKILSMVYGHKKDFACIFCFTWESLDFMTCFIILHFLHVSTKNYFIWIFESPHILRWPFGFQVFNIQKYAYHFNKTRNSVKMCRLNML